MTRTSPRRTQRSRKVCAFQVKNATGRTVVKSARLPSTRQYTRAADLGLWLGCSKLFSSRYLGAASGCAEAEVYCKQLRQKDEEGKTQPIRIWLRCRGGHRTRILAVRQERHHTADRQ
jgi:hypothetical protein